MVTRRKLRSLLSALGLYVGATLLVGYFGVSAYTGNRGLRAKQDLDQQFSELSEELARLKHERAEWQNRVALLKSESIDPDTLDERARAVLGYVGPGELTLILKRR
jgi:cell division protein FtsB